MEELLATSLGFRMGSAFRRVDRHFNRAFQRVGLSHAHGHVLVCLLETGEQRLVDVAGRTGFEPSTVSRLVKELARRKLVRRRRDPDDGRAVLLRPGARAEALRPELARAVERANERLRRELTAADLGGLLGALEIMDRLP